jgi:hypothetical protein
MTKQFIVSGPRDPDPTVSGSNQFLSSFDDTTRPYAQAIMDLDRKCHMLAATLASHNGGTYAITDDDILAATNMTVEIRRDESQRAWIIRATPEEHHAR